MKKNKITFVFIAIFCSIGGFITLRYNSRVNKIAKNPVTSTAQIYELRDSRGKYQKVTVCYKYQIDGVGYQNEDMYIEMKNGRQAEFVGRIFPIVYASNDYRNSKILITKDDFSFFNLSFPDSLEWVKEHFKY